MPHGTLTLDLTPKDSRVTLLDVVPRYRPGMRLPEGSHRVKVQRKGYSPVTRKIKVSGDTQAKISLKPVVQGRGQDRASAEPPATAGTASNRPPPSRAKPPAEPPATAEEAGAIQESVARELADHGVEVSQQSLDAVYTPPPSMDGKVVKLINAALTAYLLIKQMKAVDQALSENRVADAQRLVNTLQQSLTPEQLAGLGDFFQTLKSTARRGREVAASAPQGGARPQAASALPGGSAFQDCPGCPQMVVVPPGSFMMGSESGDSDEKPVHKVSIAYSFAVGVHEVTFAQWDACVSDGGCNGYSPDDRGWGRGNRPVINVSWEDAQSYLKWLSGKTGKSYRLLSESEWEYVARAGTTTPFHYGSTISTEQANYDGNYTYGSGAKGAYRKKTVPVGSFPPNAFGLHDVHGNVWEWTHDCWNDNYQGAPNDGSAWESGDCSRRVLRGGSWSNDPWILRSALRLRYTVGYRNIDYGFRVARTLTP